MPEAVAPAPPPRMVRFADVGDGVFVSNYEHCDDHGGDFAGIIHVYRETNRVERFACRACLDLDGPVSGLRVMMRETRPMSEASVGMDAIAEYARRPGKLLVHCRGGVCRSPTVAVVAKVARGRDAFDAIRDVWRGVWGAYREPVMLEPLPMRELLAWAESRGR